MEIRYLGLGGVLISDGSTNSCLKSIWIHQPSPLSTCYSGRVAENGIGFRLVAMPPKTGLNSITQKQEKYKSPCFHQTFPNTCFSSTYCVFIVNRHISALNTIPLWFYRWVYYWEEQRDKSRACNRLRSRIAICGSNDRLVYSSSELSPCWCWIRESSHFMFSLCLPITGWIMLRISISKSAFSLWI